MLEFKIGGEAAMRTFKRELGRRVETVRRNAVDAGDAGDIDNGAGVAVAHVWNHGLDEAKGSEEVGVHLMFGFVETDPRQRFLCFWMKRDASSSPQVFGCTLQRVSGVVHQHVDPTLAILQYVANNR